MKKVLVITPEEVHKLAVEKGFYDKEKPIPEQLCLIHSEVSEALKAYRDQVPKGEKGWIGEELADIVIRTFDMARSLDIDIIEEMDRKHTYNKTRPYRHGNKLI